jgi:serine/threonine protein kinase
MIWEGRTVVAVDRWAASTRLVLGKRLGGGLEGEAFAVQHPAQNTGWVVKIFKGDKLARKVKKIQAMLEMDPEPNASERRIAWPLNIVHHDGAPIGYSMIRVPHTQLTKAFSQNFRKELSSNLDLFSFHWLAENLSKTISSLHAKNHVVGDLKDLNATFNPDTLEVFLIDTDSFGIKVREIQPDFPADAATPEWSPPEFDSARPVGVQHDLFSLAVLFHHLMFSVHPFSGASKGHDDSMVAAIKDGRWLYRNSLTPNKVDPPFSVVSPLLQALFRRAFVDGHGDPGLRPTAKEWEEAFREARYDLKWCDKRPLHVFDGGSRRCPWCSLQPERWPTNHQPRSVTKSIARSELRGLTEGPALSKTNFERAERRFAANPAFRKDLPDVVGRLDAYKRRQAEIDGAMKSLREAERDDVKLIEVANQFKKDAELVRLARTTFGLGGLLDRAVELEVCLGRLTAAVAAAVPDNNGRFYLDGEKRLLDAFQRDTAILERSDGLLLRFAPRRTAARERLEAARMLTLALAGSGQPASPPIEHLRETMSTHGERLAEVADEDIDGKASLARDIVRLSENVEQPATIFSDEQVVAFWDRHIAPNVNIALQIVDARRAQDKASLRAAVNEARQSRDAIRKFEELLKSSKQAPNNVAVQDRVILAADPTEYVSARERTIFGATWSGQVLADARRRKKLAERIEQLALDPDRDKADPALVDAWRGTEERDLLGLSEIARNRIRSAEARMARFDRVRTVALEHPPADERLIEALAEVSADRDLLDIEVAPGQTLRARVELASQRIGLRDALASAIEEGTRVELCLESEEKISSVWNSAADARLQAPPLFAPFSARAEKAFLRVTCFRELVSALQERHGGRAAAVWQRHLQDLSDFSPVMGLKPEVDSLLSRYRDFCRLLEGAEQRVDDQELIELSESLPEALELKDADESRRSLDGRSLKQFVSGSRLRRNLREHLDALAGLALDPGRLRAELALIADQLPSYHDVEPLDGELGAQLLEATIAASRFEALQRAIADNHFDDFLKLWHETWHPLLPRTASLIPAARAIVANALRRSAIEDAAMIRLGDDAIRLSWRWPERPLDLAGKGRTVTGTEILTIAFNDRRPPSGLDDAQDVVTVFRKLNDDVGRIEISWGRDRMAAALFSGYVVAGQHIHASQPAIVAEPRRRLAYRFRAATLRERDDWLLIRSHHALLAPVLRIVHSLTGKAISLIDKLPLHADVERAVNLSQLRASSQDTARWLRKIQRIMGDESLCYELELDDPSDQDWIEIVHPTATAERQLSFLWQADTIGQASAPQ